MKTSTLSLYTIVGTGFFVSFLMTAKAVPNSIDYGNNPVVSKGGYASNNTGDVTIFSAPSDQDIMITDYEITTNYSYGCSPSLRLASGGVLAYWSISAARHIEASKRSGLRVPAGDSVILTANCSSSVYYTISGHYARP